MFTSRKHRSLRPGSLALASLRASAGSLPLACSAPDAPLRFDASRRRPAQSAVPRDAGSIAHEDTDVITELEFKSLAAQGYNRIPLHRGGLRRPGNPAVAVPEAGLRRGGGKHSFLLESVVGGERFGRYSFIGLPARTLLRATGFRTEVVTDGAGGRDARGQPAGLHRRLPEALQGGAAPGAAALLRRAGRLLRLRRGALHRAQAGQDAARPAASTRPTSCCCSARSWPSSTTCRAGCT